MFEGCVEAGRLVVIPLIFKDSHEYLFIDKHFGVSLKDSF